MQECQSLNPGYRLEHVYMRPEEVNSNRFEISNRFEMSFCLHGNLHGDFNFPNNGKALLHMCKWYLVINANLINVRQMLRYWLFFKQQQQDTCTVSNFNDSARLYFNAGI